MTLKIQQIKVPYDDKRSGEQEPPAWWQACTDRGYTVQRVDRVNNTAYGDVFEVTFYGMV